jgi:hypothetical protein
MTRTARIAFALLVVSSSPSIAQNYRVRLDARGQSRWYRGLIADRIPESDGVASPNGGLETSDGRAVRCGASDYCFFFRPGPELHGIPVSTSASIVMWGLGAEGLSLRATGRLLADLGSDDVWPGTDPSAQLIEGLLEYQRSAITARVGRQLLSSRLEAMGFDGGWLKYRLDRASLEFTGYAGWGLGQAAVVSPQNPVLNPLDEWRPRDRQIVAGAEAAWLYRDMDLRAEYRREIDPQDDYFVSERAALSMATHIKTLRLNGGIDYNIAEGRTGSADLTATFVQRRYSVSAGARRYRPYFSLWTLWGAFSPVPYNAVNLSAQVRPASWLSVNGRAERYRYDDAGISTGLVPQLQNDGWRARVGGTATVNTRLTLDGIYGLEHGPGASSRSADAQVSFAPFAKLTLELYGGTLFRPLELRYYDAKSRWIGGRAQWQQSDQRRIWADMSAVGDDRERPDTGGSSMDQLRVRGGVSIAFGSGADRTPLPPARPRLR